MKIDIAEKGELGLYGSVLLSAMADVGQAVEIAMVLRDRPAVEKMQSVCNDIFTRAFEALDEQAIH